MKNNYWPIRFSEVQINDYSPLWKHILWASIYDWDEYPKGLTITILSIDFEFFLGEWK